MSSSDTVDDDDVECPLCLDTLSFDDLSFFPCSCGYQICRFCWHHIKANLNGRCPACRKPYDDAAVEFKPMKPEELKRLQAAKKQRDKEKKDAEVTAKRHAANVRVRQRAQVHIQGMSTRIANEETLAYLKGPDQFGRFGKVIKLFFSRRPAAPPNVLGPSSAASSSALNTQQQSQQQHVPVNVYINYATAAEATACMNAIDGTVTPDGHKLKATWGTTRYCPAYLRGVKCLNDNCMQAHEAGEELEPYMPGNFHPAAGPGAGFHHHQQQQHNHFGQHQQQHHHQQGYQNNYNASREQERQERQERVRDAREEMVHLKHAYKEQQSREPALPATASWASRPNGAPQTPSFSSPSGNSPFAFPVVGASSSSSNANASDSRPSSSHAQHQSTSTSNSTHAHSFSISSRLPKAQNHPLPPRPPSRTSSVELARTKSVSKDSTSAEKDSNSKTILSARTATPPQQQPEEAQQEAQTAAAPPTPPVSEPSTSSSTSLPNSKSAAPAFPPGLLGSGTARPLTPVSEFDRTLDTFGDGSFAFNLNPSNVAATPVKGKERLLADDEEENDQHQEGVKAEQLRFDPDAADAPTQGRDFSRDVSRDGSPSIRGRQQSSANENLWGGSETKTSYEGPFDPFAFTSEPEPSGASRTGSASVSRSESPATFLPPHLNGSSSKLEGPPGLSRQSTAASSTGGVAKTAFALPPGLEDAAPSSRHRSRFGFARPGSTEKLPGSSPMGHGTGSGSGASNPVADLFKGLNGSFTSSNGTGGMSPIRPGSAHSSGSGSHGFGIPPPGIFAASAVNGAHSSGTGSSASFSLPGHSAATSVFANSPRLPSSSENSSNGNPAGQGEEDGSVTPGKKFKKPSLTDLFPGVDLASSFSASSTLPPALLKTLGISMENLDLQASNVANGKLPNFGPLPVGGGSTLASQPLPPKHPAQSLGTPSLSRGTTSSSSSSASHQQQQQQHHQQQHHHGSNTSHSTGGPPPGFGSARQAQQAHAQNAQQAHQAHVAAQLAAAAAAAQQQQQQQVQQNQGHFHGRPPSAASGGSKQSHDNMYSGSYMASPPPGMPGTPSPYGDNGSNSARFQDPAIISFANMGGFGQQPPQYGLPFGMHDQMSPGAPAPGQGQNGVDFYNRYQPLPTPVQPQQTYNPYIPVGPVGLNGMPGVVNIPGGMGRMGATQAMSPGGPFGMMRR